MTFDESPSGSGGTPFASSGSIFSTARSVRRIAARDLGVDLVALLVPKRTVTSVRALDHVGVGEDRALLVDHEARAGRGALASGSPKGDCSRADALGLDEHDAAALLLVDVGHACAAVAGVVGGAGATTGSRTTSRVVSPVSITSVAISTAPSDEHDQPAEEAGEELEAGCSGSRGSWREL